ncbi:phosphomannomutase [Pedococcus dokdonensis]|uniref:Phosphomannomutase n=1 Tax=Pedococcus dokdonensis TaxID=443156 RepID=A0A1H0RKS2_9MICO|nr:phospho-sugar mutase [Pedococcus dokdonensis]SDP30094.1 phosphomannomutase [Pedococcus dokdonensis]
MTYAARHGRGADSPTSPEDSARERAQELVDAAQAWVDDDPDHETRVELGDVLARVKQGDQTAVDDLADRFSGMLEFGTAGLRGALGAGPNRMNRSVVIRAAAGLTAYLQARKPQPFVVVGFDARRNSDVFARDTAAVVVGAGGRAAILPEPLPTPVLAYAIRFLGADAGVMVTASHNPPEDNGYKVYLGDGSQIVPPSDTDIATQIARVNAVADVPLAEDGWETLGDDVLAAYLEDVVTVVSADSARDVTVVHTALHGVGSETVAKAFVRAGYAAPIPVESQAQPDPAFPTVHFPNPEEPGAMDAALELAEQTGPDVVIANDPDADRCAVAVPGPGGWRMLRGDEVGALLGAHILARGVADGDVFANSIVSSRLLAAMATAAGVPHEETLTGFKWISRVDGLRYGYEEALGYCVDPPHVRDKDGVSAALVVAEMTATLKAEGRSLTDLLDDLATAHGVHATDSFSVRVADLSLIGTVMARLRDVPPTDVAGTAVARTDDLSQGSESLPPTDGLRYYLADDSRIIVRPSGTEPKLKVYLEVIEPVSGDLAAARKAAADRLAAIRSAMEELTAL